MSEVHQARRVVENTADEMAAAGIEVNTFHDNTSDDQEENLEEIVSWHNSQDRDFDVLAHDSARSLYGRAYPRHRLGGGRRARCRPQ